MVPYSANWVEACSPFYTRVLCLEILLSKSEIKVPAQCMLR